MELTQQEKENIYNSVLESISKTLVKYLGLNEKYGMKEYDNKKLENELYNIASKITYSYMNIIKNKLNYNYKLYENGKFKRKLYGLSFNIESVDWLDKLNIYFTLEQIDEKNIGNDTMTLSNSCGYMYNSETEKTELSKIKRQIFTNDNKMVNVYLVKDNTVNTASILFSFYKGLYNKDYLVSILEHEINHIFDMYIQNIDNTKLNQDQLLYDWLTPISVETSELYRDLVSSKLTYNDKVNIIKNGQFTYDALSELFKGWIYLLNESELHARLYNFNFELIHTTTKYNCGAKVEQNIIRYLHNISPIFREYYDIYQILKIVKEYLPDYMKEQFAKTDIKLVYNKEFNEDFLNKYPYNRKFKGSNNIKIFNNFIQFHIDRIYNIFLHNATSLTYEKIYEKQSSFGNVCSGSSRTINEDMRQRWIQLYRE